MSEIAAEIIQVPTETKLPTEISFKVRAVSFDGLMRDADVGLVTGLSRMTRWRLAREGEFPAKVQVSPGRVANIGQEILEYIKSRPRVGADT